MPLGGNTLAQLGGGGNFSYLPVPPQFAEGDSSIAPPGTTTSGSQQTFFRGLLDQAKEDAAQVNGANTSVELLSASLGGQGNGQQTAGVITTAPDMSQYWVPAVGDVYQRALSVGTSGSNNIFGTNFGTNTPMGALLAGGGGAMGFLLSSPGVSNRLNQIVDNFVENFFGAAGKDDPLAYIYVSNLFDSMSRRGSFAPGGLAIPGIQTVGSRQFTGSFGGLQTPGFNIFSTLSQIAQSRIAAVGADVDPAAAFNQVINDLYSGYLAILDPAKTEINNSAPTLSGQNIVLSAAPLFPAIAYSPGTNGIATEITGTNTSIPAESGAEIYIRKIGGIAAVVLIDRFMARYDQSAQTNKPSLGTNITGTTESSQVSFFLNNFLTGLDDYKIGSGV